MGKRATRQATRAAGDVEPFVNTKGLGETQIEWLLSTHEHQGHWRDNWYSGNGRVWDTHAGTIKLCESLVKRGLMQAIAKPKLGRVEYWLTNAGKKFADEERARRNAAIEAKRALLQ